MVEWKYINDIIVSLRTGLNPRQNFRLNTPESYFPYITGKDIFNNKINVTSVTDKVDSKAVELINKRANLEDNLLLFASTGTGTVGRMAIVDKYENDWAISETLYAIKTSQAISPQFLMYSLYSYIAKKQYEPKISKGSVPHLKIADLLKVKIPVPVISEQQRIVGILDTFTSSIENLKEQIAQRRKQYEFYRDQLLDLEGKEGVEMKIEEFCLLKAGKSVSADDISEYYHKNNYPCIGGNGVRGYVPLYSHEGEYPIIGRQGALCGCVNWITGKFYATEHAVVASGYDGINQRFLFYLFENADLNQYKTQGAQPGLSVTKLII